METSILSSILFATIVAGTPLIIVALGQLIAEKSGVLNLGAEGMMSMGAIAGFAVTFETGNVWLGVLAGMAAGLVMSWLFAVVVLTLMGNQVATGLALSILGVGLSAFIGKPYESEILPTVGAVRIPLLADIPIIGNPLFNQQILVYFSWAMFGAIVWFLYRSRPGLVLRAVGESPSSAHSIGYPVIRIRYMATLIRWCHGGHWRRFPVGILYALMGRRHGLRARLDCDRAGCFCNLAAVSRHGRCLPVRWRHGGAVVRAGLRARDKHSVAVPVGPAVPGDDHRAGNHLARPEHGTPECAGIAGTALPAGCLIS